MREKRKVIGKDNVNLDILATQVNREDFNNLCIHLRKQKEFNIAYDEPYDDFEYIKVPKGPLSISYYIEKNKSIKNEK